MDFVYMESTTNHVSSPGRSVLDSSNFDDYPPDAEPLPQDDLSGWDADF